jgi:hypothetical protein
MKKLFAALVLMCPLLANAGSWFQFEAGIGAQKSSDMGDGIWVQYGMPHKEALYGPAFMAGITGRVYERGAVDVRYHADYVYFGGMQAGCLCTEPDATYSIAQRRNLGGGTVSEFYGQGHTQGIALTLQPGYTWHGIRLAVEGGPWVNWSTWHETAYLPGDTVNGSHRTVVQLAWVAGASVEYNGWALSYRHYWERQSWNPFPGIVTGTDMLMLTKRF